MNQEMREKLAEKLRQLVLLREGTDTLGTIWQKEADKILSLETKTHRIAVIPKDGPIETELKWREDEDSAGSPRV